MEAGKLPPQAPELEQAVLGALMLERNAVNEAIDILQPESFYVDAHRKIFDAILGLFRNDQPIDILTVTEELKKRGVLTASADAHALATGLLAALQGGYLLAKTARDVRPMRVVLDMAIAQVRAYSTESGSV